MVRLKLAIPGLQTECSRGFEFESHHWHPHCKFLTIYNDAIHQLDKLNSFPAIAFELYSSMARALGL